MSECERLARAGGFSRDFEDVSPNSYRRANGYGNLVFRATTGKRQSTAALAKFGEPGDGVAVFDLPRSIEHAVAACNGIDTDERSLREGFRWSIVVKIAKAQIVSRQFVEPGWQLDAFV